jgi:outer membrane protein OmpA-like peptidoglycan-associated protein
VTVRPVRVAASVLLAGAAVFCWALLWPASWCSEPACARQRFTVAVEIDALRQVPPIALEVVDTETRVSLESIMAAGGIGLEVHTDQLDLPYQSASGALDRADLYQFAAAWRNRESPAGADAGIYALLTTSLISDTGEPLFGIMFDIADREAIAVAPATIARFFGEREQPSVRTLQLRTFAHELLHALNRHHLDAVPMQDGRLTLEAPTRCISDREGSQWYLRESPLMAISPQTIRFLQTADSRDILPGKRNVSFTPARASPTECDEVRASRQAIPAETRWQLAMRRLRSLMPIGTADAAEGDEESSERRGAQPAVDLRIQALPSSYPLGYPIAVRVLAHNLESTALPLKGRLSPGYGMVSIEYRSFDASDWSQLQPLSWFEPMDDDGAMLAPDEWTEQTIPIYFSEQGWTFPRPGDYEVRARLRIDDSGDDIPSEPVMVSVHAPETVDDRAALQPLLDSEGRLDNAVGRFLTFGGRIGSHDGIDPLDATVTRYSHTALGNALRLTLLSQRLRRPIDPQTGTRPIPDFSDAREQLRETCADSGVTALKYDLLRYARAVPDDIQAAAQLGAAAWDGTTTARRAMSPTYSDPSLRAWGPSLHFCFNETTLDGPVQQALRPLARQLSRLKPMRIVVIGHTDYQGTCRNNDDFGLQRANAVKRALVAAGVQPRNIQVASLGERRPIDFALSTQAHASNRRVEILVESADAPRHSGPERVTPDCTR